MTDRAPENRRPALMVAALAIAAPLLFLPLPIPGTFIWDAAQAAAHAPLFGTLCWVAQRALRLGSLRTWILMAAAAAATELLQQLVGRNASALDLFNDLVGVTAAVSLASHARRRARIKLGVAAVCVAIAAAPFAWSTAAYWKRQRQFPVLLQYSSPLDLYFIERSGSTQRHLLPRTCSAVPGSALRIPLGQRAFAGVLLHEPVADWRGWDTLLIRLASPDPGPLALTVRVHDERHDWTYADRYNRVFPLAIEDHAVIRVPLEEIAHGPANGRYLDLSRIAGVAVFRATSGPASSLCLYSIELARSPQ